MIKPYLDDTVVGSDEDVSQKGIRKHAMNFISSLFRKGGPRANIEKGNLKCQLLDDNPGGECQFVEISTFKVHKDIEALRLSRQDNPYLQQKLSSQESLNLSHSDCVISPKRNKRQILGEMESFPRDPLDSPDTHEHLVRSPPPVHQHIFSFPMESDVSPVMNKVWNPTKNHKSSVFHGMISRSTSDVLDDTLREDTCGFLSIQGFNITSLLLS